MTQQSGTVAWAVQSADLSMALQEVKSSAAGPNTKGFMLAFTGRRTSGFSFLVCEASFSAALYLVQGWGWRAPLEYTCAFEQGAGSNSSFVEQYLQGAARNMQVDYRQLVDHFAERKSGWRFQPWEDGRPGHSRDNDCMWRKDLWPLVRGIVDVPPACLDGMPSEVRAAMLKQLRGHAREGMIVLDQ